MGGARGGQAAVCEEGCLQVSSVFSHESRIWGLNLLMFVSIVPSSTDGHWIINIDVFLINITISCCIICLCRVFSDVIGDVVSQLSHQFQAKLVFMSFTMEPVCNRLFSPNTASVLGGPAGVLLKLRILICMKPG